VQASVPRPDQTVRETVVSAVTCSTTYQASTVVDVTDAREVTFELFHNFNAGDPQRLSILPLLSTATAAPLATADEWTSPGISDGSVTAAVIGGTLLSGADFTANPEFGRVTMRSLEISTELANNSTDELRMAVTIKCAHARWFHLQFAEHGGGTAGVLTVHVTKSC
jgi:hypothetical protein